MIQRIGLAVVAVLSTKFAIPLPPWHERLAFHMGERWRNHLAGVPVHPSHEQRRVLLAIAAVGVPVDKLTVLIGAFGVGIGFGLQSIFNNLVSGFIL